MKVLLLLGGFLGFGIGLLFSCAEQCSGPTCLWHACLAAYLTAWLMRWWGTSWQKNLIEALQERQAKAMAAAAASHQPLIKPTKS